MGLTLDRREVLSLSLSPFLFLCLFLFLAFFLHFFFPFLFLFSFLPFPFLFFLLLLFSLPFSSPSFPFFLSQCLPSLSSNLFLLFLPPGKKRVSLGLWGRVGQEGEAELSAELRVVWSVWCGLFTALKKKIRGFPFHGPLALFF